MEQCLDFYSNIRYNNNSKKGSLMTKTIQLLRGTTAQNDAFTGAAGELTVDTTTNELRVHDGSTAGGHRIYTKAEVDTALSGKADTATTYTKTEVDNIASGKANVALNNLTNAGTEVIAHNAMPSKRSIDLTLPASGGSITAPADGYLYLAKTSSASGQRVKFTNTSSANMAVSTWSSGTQNLEIIMPVSKNNVVYLYYTADGTTNQFRFIYANGAQ